MTTITIERSEGSMSKMGVHVGNLVMDAAGKYNTLVSTALEGIQNAIDAQATVVFVGIDLKDRVSVIADNGTGVTLEQFESALATVGHSQKLRDPGKLGQFGIGLISPLDKCKFFEFISTPRQGPTRAWTFSQEKVKKSEGEPDIPNIILTAGMPTLETTFEPEARKLGVRWSTMVRMYDITKDRVVSKLTCDGLAADIKSRFGEAMRTRDTVCYIFIRDTAGRLHRAKVEPYVYTGEPIEGSPFVITGDQAGSAVKITIELYRAVQKGGKRAGKVKISEGRGAVFGVSLEAFLTQAKEELGYDPKDSFGELNSGYFEGLIRVDGLSLNVRRKGFLVDESLLDTVVALDSWYDRTGRQFYEGEKDRERNDRYRDLTNLALADVTKLLDHPDFLEFRDGIRENVEFESSGADSGESQDVAAKDREPTDIERKSGPTKKKKPAIRDPHERKPDGSDVSLGPADPSRGRRRSAVRSNSTGLIVEVTEFELSNDLWRFVPATGTLMFNCANDVWAELDGASSNARRRPQYHDQWIVNLQKWVITQLAAMFQLPAEQRDDFARVSRDSARLYASLVIKPNKSLLTKPV